MHGPHLWLPDAGGDDHRAVEHVPKAVPVRSLLHGPKSYPFYRAGIVRRVPGRKGMSYTEEDLVDEKAVAHRDPDE